MEQGFNVRRRFLYEGRRVRVISSQHSSESQQVKNFSINRRCYARHKTSRRSTPSSTLVYIEENLNSIPPCLLSSDTNYISTITSGHFLTLTPLAALPELNLKDIPIGCLLGNSAYIKAHLNLPRQPWLFTTRQRQHTQRHIVPFQVMCKLDRRQLKRTWLRRHVVAMSTDEYWVTRQVTDTPEQRKKLTPQDGSTSVTSDVIATEP
ncbi:hypothetical protein PR048_011464 [Dryococelus australis]|uniref:Uncharacterized protein n=1 Tax=Dryococelus australis TaxID=614101 RepID=A0ABQ9HLR6_9NEOP|nr:hypothetical protein PR048_011464 [Dryococelus australis]